MNSLISLHMVNAGVELRHSVIKSVVQCEWLVA
jgi:hypothetical protein